MLPDEILFKKKKVFFKCQERGRNNQNQVKLTRIQSLFFFYMNSTHWKCTWHFLTITWRMARCFLLMNSRERPTDRFGLEVTRNHCKLSFLPKPVGPPHLEILHIHHPHLGNPNWLRKKLRAYICKLYMHITYALFQQKSHIQLKSELYSAENTDAQVFTSRVDVLVNSHYCLSFHLN